jgi:hypothetical protein
VLEDAVMKKDDPVIRGGADTVMHEMKKLNPEFGDFTLPHWRQVKSCSFGIQDGVQRVWVSLDGRWQHKDGHMQWFDTLEEMDAWLLACWRMK